MSRPSTLVQLPSAVDGGPFAAEVRALRAAAELSHAEAAQRVGVSLRWWYYLHRGTRPPRPADVLAVAHLDPLTTPAADTMAESLAKGGPVPPFAALAVAHLAHLAGYPLADVSQAVALAISPEALDAATAARQTGAEALARLEALNRDRPMDLIRAALQVHLTAVLDRLDVILPRLTGKDPA